MLYLVWSIKLKQLWIISFSISHNSLIAGYEADIITKIETIGKDATETLPTLLIKTISKVISGGTTILLGFMIGFYVLFDFKRLKNILYHLFLTFITIMLKT